MVVFNAYYARVSCACGYRGETPARLRAEPGVRVTCFWVCPGCHSGHLYAGPKDHLAAWQFGRLAGQSGDSAFPAGAAL